MDIKDRRTALERARHEQQKAEAAVAARDSKARELDEAAEQARRKVEAAERELKNAEREELRKRLERAEQVEVETRETVTGSLHVLGQLVAQAREARAQADALRREAGIPVSSVDLIEHSVVAALVETGVIDGRSVGTPISVLRKLAPEREAERRGREARLDEEKRQAAERWWSPQNVGHELRILSRRIKAYEQSSGRTARERLAEAMSERDALVAGAEKRGVPIEVAA